MIVWRLTEQQADQVFNALGQQPFYQVNGLFNELLRQAREQQQQQQQQPQTGPQEPPPPVQHVNGAAAP
jgi:hypothetical protein